MQDIQYSTLDCDIFAKKLEKKIAKQTGGLVIFYDKSDDGSEVNLLPLSDWEGSSDSSQKDNHPNKQVAYIRRQSVNFLHVPIHIADFIGLKPSNYKIWMSESKLRNVSIQAEEVTTVDWRKSKPAEEPLVPS